MKSYFLNYLSGGRWFSIAAVVFSIIGGTFSILATDFPADPASLGAIPDYPAAQTCRNEALYVDKDVTFTVSGMPSFGAADEIQIKNLTFSPAHTYAGDLVATLIAPDGVTKRVIFGRLGATSAGSAGDSSDLAGPYYFDNSYSASFWDTALAVAGNQPIPTGVYRFATGVSFYEYQYDLAQGFSNVTNTNGTWTLRFDDTCNGDTGGVAAVTLSIVHRPKAADAPNDRNGDGKTDFTIVRSDGAVSLAGSMGVADESDRANSPKMRERAAFSPQVVQLGWWTSYNGTSAFDRTSWGLNTDQFVSEDFDGDGKDDIAVWRPGPAGVEGTGFHILQSADNTYKYENFGQTGDFANVVGDWDGDGKADAAVYRDGTAQSPQSYFFFRGSKNNPNGNVVYIPWGRQGDIGYTGDFDGDGKVDPAVQRNVGGNNAVHYVFKSSNGSTYSLQWGFATDYVAPGDYDGDGRTDLAVVRDGTSNGAPQKLWFIAYADSAGANYSNQIAWGKPGDYICQGDYDGDGTTDRAVWRPTDGTFYAMTSYSNNIQYKWGKSGDVPAANWNVH
ncbi:MAG: VCBS repeat-containing protein [Acidobacteria bacterium]|nr:VCBS repeat-containing protein [Acidobacteriota bacterium]